MLWTHNSTVGFHKDAEADIGLLQTPGHQRHGIHGRLLRHRSIVTTGRTTLPADGGCSRALGLGDQRQIPIGTDATHSVLGPHPGLQLNDSGATRGQMSQDQAFSFFTAV